MSEFITEQQFNNNTPNYVPEANALSRAIINRALADPDSGIELRAIQPAVDDPAEKLEYTIDPSRLRELWEHQPPRVSFAADMPVAAGDSRIALNYSLWLSDTTKSWLYKPEELPPRMPPPTQNALLLDFQERERREAEEPVAPGRLNSRARQDPRNLISPEVTFRDGYTLIRQEPATVGLALYSPDDYYNKHVGFSAYSGNMITADMYHEAIAPQLTEEDAEILEQQGVYGLHTAHIQRLLAALSLAASTNPPHKI